MYKNHKLLTKAEYKLKTNSPKTLYNYARFGKPINMKLSEGILKRRSRSYSFLNFPIKFNFCWKCFSFRKLERHHLDYKNPNKIVILCRKCHNKKYHRKI